MVDLNTLTRKLVATPRHIKSGYTCIMTLTALCRKLRKYYVQYIAINQVLKQYQFKTNSSQEQI